jgi:isochorismate hydrolase
MPDLAVHGGTLATSLRFSSAVSLVAKGIANHLAVAVKDVEAFLIDVHGDLLINPLIVVNTV